MKFFPYESDRLIQEDLPDYFAYVDTLGGAIPEHLLFLMDKRLGLDDGLLVRVKHDRQRRRLELVIRGGYSAMGYYDLSLRYEGAEISPEHDAILARIARTTLNCRRYESDLCWHEFDVAGDGKLVHRPLFHRSGSDRGAWFEIKCESITWRMRPRVGRCFRPMKDRYPGGPPMAA